MNPDEQERDENRYARELANGNCVVLSVFNVLLQRCYSNYLCFLRYFDSILIIIIASI